MTRPRATTVDQVFAALANPTRREVLRVLRDEGQQPVQQLAARFAMRRPSVSEHLHVLRDAGLVREHKRGRQRVYALDAEPLMNVHAWLAPYEQFWRANLRGLRDLLDEEANDDGTDDLP